MNVRGLPAIRLFQSGNDVNRSHQGREGFELASFPRAERESKSY